MEWKPLNQLVLPVQLQNAKHTCLEIANHALELHQRMHEILEGRGSLNEFKLADQNLAHLIAYMPHLRKLMEERQVFDAGYKAGVIDAAQDLPQIQAHLSQIVGSVTFVPIFRSGGELRVIRRGR